MCGVVTEFLEFFHPSFYCVTVLYVLVRFTLYPVVSVITRINIKYSSNDIIKELHCIAHCDTDKESNHTSVEERFFCQSQFVVSRCTACA